MKAPEGKVILKNRMFEIRPLAPDESELLCAAVQSSLEAIGRWENWAIPDYGLTQARTFLELSRQQWRDARGFNFNVFERASGDIVGSISINQIDSINRRGNVGYWTRSSHCGQGIAPMAVLAVARFGFRDLDLVRLEIVAQERNKSSRRVAEKVGARLECVARNRLMFHGEPRDAAVYCLLESDVRSALSIRRRRSSRAS